MKYCKRFTEGLGYFACFLILAFLAYSYFTFGKSFVDEETGEVQNVINNVKGFREYLILLGIFGGALVISSATDRVPFIGAVVSVVPAYYIFRIYAGKLLVFCPMIIMILSLFFFAGEIIATVQWARSKLLRRDIA